MVVFIIERMKTHILPSNHISVYRFRKMIEAIIKKTILNNFLLLVENTSIVRLIDKLLEILPFAKTLKTKNKS